VTIACPVDPECTYLTRVVRERDGVREELTRQAAANEDLAATLAMRTGQLRSARESLALARAELASARQELKQLRAGFAIRRDLGIPASPQEP